MKKFDSIIIGFGKAGKTLAVTLAKKGEKVALIEKSKKMYGGTCINIGCIPSKKILHESLKKTTENKENFYKNSIKNKKELIELLRGKNFSMLDSEENITIFDGIGSFENKNSIKIVGENFEEIISAEKIFINTGAKSVIPDIKGIKDCKNVYTSTTLMDLEAFPEKLIIIGAGYIGLEFAGFYSNFGTKVTVLNKYDDILPKEEEEIVELINEDFEKKGVKIVNNMKVLEINEKDNKVFVKISKNGEEKTLEANAVLVSAGRKPNIEKLNLEKAGIEVESGAIKVNEKLETSVKNIFALGDVKGGPQFTFISLDDFRIVFDNLFGEGKRTTFDRKNFAYCLFLTPPLSRIGLTEKQAKEKGFDIKVGKLQVGAIPKAKILEETHGLFKVIVDNKTNLILGASLYGPESFEVINIISLAMQNNLTYDVLNNHIFTHPTISESLNDLFKI